MVFVLSFVPQVWGQTEVCEPDPDITKDFVKLFSKCDAKKSNYCKCLAGESKGNKNELFSALQKESNKDYQTLLANYKQLQVTRWMRMYSEMTVGVSLQKTLLSLDGHQGLDCHPLDVSAKFRATVSNKIKNEDGDDGKADLLEISSTSGSYEAVVDEMSDINKYSRLQKIKEFYTLVEKNSDKALEIEGLMAQVRSSQNLTLSQKSLDEIKRKRDEAIVIFDNYIYEKGREDPSFVKFGKIRDFGECRFMDDNFDMSHDKLCSELVNTKYTATDQYERNLEKKASNQCFSYADFLVYKGMPGDSILAALEGGRFDIRSVQSNKELEAQRLAFLKANPVLTQMMDNPGLRKELLKGLKRISEVNRNKSERDKLNAYLNYMKNDVSKIIDTDSSLVAQVVNCDDMTNGLVAISVADDIPDAYGGKFSDEPAPVNGISDLKNNMLMCQQKDANSNLEATLNIVTAYAVTPKTFEDYENEEQLKTRDYEGFLAQNCEGFDDYLKKCGDTEDCRKKYMTSNTKSVSSGNIANPLPPEEVIKKVKKQTQSTPEQIKLKNDIRSQLPKSSLPVVATRGKEKQFNDQRIANEEKISKIDVPRSKTQSVKQAQHNVPQQSPQGKEIVPVKEVQASNKLLPVLTPTSPVQNKISENTEVLKSPPSIEKSAKKGESLVQKQPINKLSDPKQKISQTPPSMPTPRSSTLTPEKVVQNVVLNPRVTPDPKVVAALPKQPKENLMNTALVKMYEKSEVRALPGKVNSKEFNGVQVSEIDLVIKDEKTFEKIISNPEDLEAYIKRQFVGKSIPASSIITIINPKNGVPLAFRVRMTADGSFEIQSLPSEVKVVRKSTLKDLKLNLNSVQSLR
jgi:hypothetical protein